MILFPPRISFPSLVKEASTNPWLASTLAHSSPACMAVVPTRPFFRAFSCEPNKADNCTYLKSSEESRLLPRNITLALCIISIVDRLAPLLPYEPWSYSGGAVKS